MGRPDFCCTLQQKLPAEPSYGGRGVVAWPLACLSLFESMRLMRLSVKKAAYAGVSRAA